MTKNYPFPEVQDKLGNSQKVLIVLGQNPKYDAVASALSIYLSLQEIGKNASIVCPSPMTVEFNRLVGVDRISPKVKGTDLIVSFNYSMDNVEKISYNDDNGKLNLVLQPKVGSPALNEQAVAFSYAGMEADTIITVGIKSLEQVNLGSALTLSAESIINIDNGQGNSNFGAINIQDYDSSCLSEVTLGLLSGLNLPLTTDICQNLISGIWVSTNGLKRSDLGADTYEAVAICLRYGAQKPADTFQQTQRPTEVVQQPQRVQQEPPRQQQEQFQPKQKQQWTNPPKVEPKKEEPQPQPQNPPKDWFEPKIYKGSNIS